MTGKCKTCKRWGRDYEGECDGEAPADTPPIDGFVITAYAHDDSGMYTRMLTGPEFGCVRHTPRTDDTDEGEDDAP